MTTLHRDPDLDRLISELNRRRRAEGGTPSSAADEPAAAPRLEAGLELRPADPEIDDLELRPAPPSSGEPGLRPEPPLAEPDDTAGPAADRAVRTRRSPAAATGAQPLWRRPEVAGGALQPLLTEMTRRGASDLLLVAGEPPVLRIDGELVKTEREPLGPGAVEELLEPYLGPPDRERLAVAGAVDLSLRFGPGRAVSSGWRFRVNLHRQRGDAAAAVRALPREIPSLEALGLPPELAALVEPRRGLVLVCGPTGAGKSTTLAALIAEINRRRRCHVLTIEDPIEYEHEGRRAIVEQVEVGTDAPSFAAALKAALRQDPDVVLVGEMRDLETVATALTAAETGHLILSTLHTHDAASAVHRIVDVFPAAQQQQIRQQLALALNAIVCQQLVPRIDRPGRVPAVEVLRANVAVRNHVRSGKLQNLTTEITLGKSQGMVSLEESLARLVRSGVIDPAEASARSARPEELASLLG